MNNSTIKYVGLDVHEETITIAIADENRQGEIRNYGTIPHTLNAVEKFLRKQISQGVDLRCIYEAGPTGFGLYLCQKSESLISGGFCIQNGE